MSVFHQHNWREFELPIKGTTVFYLRECRKCHKVQVNPKASGAWTDFHLWTMPDWEIADFMEARRRHEASATEIGELWRRLTPEQQAAVKGVAESFIKPTESP